MSTEPLVFVVDDDPAGRQSLQWLIESIGFSVRLYGSAQEFLNAYDAKTAGCLVLDVRMPGMSGLDLQERLASRHISLPIIIITGYADVPMAVQAMKVGAMDFLEKPFNEQKLLDRVQAAIKLDARRRAETAARAALQERLDDLTPRERQVLEMVVAGKATKQVALSLRLSPKTVEIHRSHMMDKMCAGSLAELVRMAVSLGIQIEGADPVTAAPAGGAPPA